MLVIGEYLFDVAFGRFERRYAVVVFDVLESGVVSGQSQWDVPPAMIQQLPEVTYAGIDILTRIERIGYPE